MGKIIGFTLLVAAVFIILNKDKVEDIKRRVIETINPAVKEKRLIGELGSSLDNLDSLLSGKNSNAKSSEENIKRVKSAVSGAKKVLDELQETNRQTDLGANLSNLIQKFLPLELKPSPTWLPPAPGSSCKP